MDCGVTCVLRVDQTNPGHTWASIFVGRNPGARGHAGVLAFRTDELAELLEMSSGAAPESPDTPFRVGDRYSFAFDPISAARAVPESDTICDFCGERAAAWLLSDAASCDSCLPTAKERT